MGANFSFDVSMLTFRRLLVTCTLLARELTWDQNELLLINPQNLYFIAFSLSLNTPHFLSFLWV